MTMSPGAGRRVSSTLPVVSVTDSSTWPEARNTTMSPPWPPRRRVSRAARRSRVAGRVDRVLNTALAGEGAAVLNVPAAELLAEAVGVASSIEAALSRPGVGVMGHWMVHQLLRRSNLYDELVNSLASPNAVTRAAAARICGAARITDSVLWISDLVKDPNPRVREAAVRSLGHLGGRRAVDELMASAGEIALYRLAIAPARAAT